MKWCFLINNAPSLSEFFGKLSGQILKRNDECLIILTSKMAEYSKKKFFPEGVKFISFIDWCAYNHKKENEEFFGVSWKESFPLFYRNGVVRIDYNKSVEITLQTVQFIKFIFENEKPDVIVSESPTGLLHEVARRFCAKFKIPYLGLEDSRLIDRLELYDSYSDFDKVFIQLSSNDISKEEKKYAQKFVEGFISHTIASVDYRNFGEIHFSQVGIIKHYLKRLKEVAWILLKYLTEKKSSKSLDYDSEIIFRRALLSPFIMEKRQFRIFSQKNIFSKISEKDKDFFLFPLQLQPESSTYVCATYYCDQLNTIKNISLTLPFPYKIYVKEHPASVGKRPRSFYKELKKIPNLVLIDPYENMQEIIKKSDGVITLTSTVGMEAALAGKPVYVLGRVFYSYHPFCRRVNNFDELKSKIKYDLTNKPNVDNLEDINNRFVTACLRNTIKGSIVSASNNKDDINDYEQILDNLKNILIKYELKIIE